MNPFENLARVMERRPGDAIRSDKPVVYNKWGLTAGQCEVVRLTALGLTAIEVGTSMGLSAVTVYGHLDGARKKMGVTSITRAAVLWDREFPEVQQ